MGWSVLRVAQGFQPGLRDPLTNMFGMWEFFFFLFLISELPGSLQDPAKGFYLMKMNLIDKCLLFAWTLSEFLHPSAEMLFPGQGEEPHHRMS